MAINPKYIELKKKYMRPFFYCSSTKHKYHRFPIPPEDIYRCTVKQCYCKSQCGWIATCRECGIILHNCIWGCDVGIPLTRINIKKENNIETYRKDNPISFPLLFHGQAFHFNHPRNLEY